MDEFVLMSDRRISATPMAECGERLVDVRRNSTLLADTRKADTGGRELDLGTCVNAPPETSAGACYTQATNIPDEARALRHVLVAALAAAGLVNYPTEWWHWSYGDRYWALATNTAAARYGQMHLG